ncbi:peptidoglycan-binding domain-containing protein [Actinokineospora bangkokensis]|uniref:Peptidoglycan binding-like domain-containing protein n=1 Tax=Actinokineospora bangkokensis TaxID=1193682 RepID=A0A1Q9LLJ3_9PSEU|nr:peptidoglycan-binding domain-containing protein [Actinokineospora bangkokensis]OLR92891.1 hypothetical protein BJP25_18105 [Actinokineospora bangkokensis]
MPPLPPLDPATLPLVLAGPVVRRVDRTSATVWFALRSARRATLEVLAEATEQTGETPVASGTSVTTSLGANLHVVAITATTAGTTQLRPGTIHRYRVRFAEGAAADPVPPTAAEHLLAPGVVASTTQKARDRLVYGTADKALPSFATPPDAVARLRLFHTSGRKPHGQGADALSLLDDVLKVDHADAARRPQQLFLTGDQVYADDVADVLLHLCATRGTALLGRTEALPGATDADLRPGHRQDLVRDKARARTRQGASHLLRFSEFAAMHLLTWSDALWPEGKCTEWLADVHPEVAAALGVTAGQEVPATPAGTTTPSAAQATAARFREDALRVEEFRKGLVAVRRALANTATYTALGDHEVTDDWFHDGEVLTEQVAAPLGKRLLANSLAAHAVFQAWGNTPAQFAAGQPGRKLLDALATPDPTAAAPAAEIALRTGVPTRVFAGSIERADGALNWHYRIEWPVHQAVVLDTHTRRFFPSGPTSPPALVYGDLPFRDMVDAAADTGLEKVTLLVSAEPVVGHPFLGGFARPELRNMPAEATALIADSSGWGNFRTGFESLVARLLALPEPAGAGTDADPKVRRRRVIALSGEVGYGFAARLSYEASSAFQRPGTGAVRGVLAQLTAGSARGESSATVYLHQNGTIERSKAIPAVERVGWANDRSEPLDIGFAPDPSQEGRTIQWRVPSTPAVADVTAKHTLTKNPEWRYRVDFYRHEDPDRLNPRTGAPAAVTFPPEDAKQRAKALGWYIDAATNHLGFATRWGDGKQLVGRNNLAELTFAWGDGDAKSVVQSLWWRPPNQAGGAPLTRLAVPLDVGQAPSLPVETLPKLYHDRLLVEGTVDAGDAENRKDVLALQRDLFELGFTFVDRNGRYDRKTRWAVREFQTYAKYGKVARVGSAFTRVRVALDVAGLVLKVDSAAGFPAAPFMVRVGYETLKVTEVAGTDWTVERGQVGTGAAAHEVTDAVTWLPVDTSVAGDQQWYGWASALESTSVHETRRFTGHVSGEVDTGTRTALARWKVNLWRCPVVVEGWDLVQSTGAKKQLQRLAAADGRPARVADNLWIWDETKGEVPDGIRRRAYARDFGDHWVRPAGREADTTEREKCTVIGHLTTITLPVRSADPAAKLYGPVTEPGRKECWAEAEMLPQRFTGQAITELGPGRLPTFKVIRAVAEVEALAFFDGVNCYDNAFASMGVCHWTLGARQWQSASATRPARELWDVADGELWAYFALLRARYPQAYDKVIGHAGIVPDRVWQGDGKTAAAGSTRPWDPGQRKYAARGARLDRTGTARPLNGFTAANGSGISSYGQYGELEFFRMWHWHYRFVMAARTVDDFTRAQWDMTRVRLRDVRGTRWESATGTAATLVDGATIGDVFRSEATAAMIHRLHVNGPGFVLDGHSELGAVASSEMRSVLSKAKASTPLLTWGKDPATWRAQLPPDPADPAGEPRFDQGQEHEKRLIDALNAVFIDPGPALPPVPPTADDPNPEQPADPAPHPANHGTHGQWKDPGHSMRIARAWPAWYAASGTPAMSNGSGWKLPVGDLPAEQRTLLLTRTFALDTEGLPA